MKMFGATLLAGVGLAAALFMVGSSSDVRTTSGENAGFLYSVPFRCLGENEDVIMVHNFGMSDVTMEWKVSQANEVHVVEAFPGPISGFDKVNLTANLSTAIYCPDIKNRFDGKLTLSLGFVEIISPVELNVVGIHFRESHSLNVTSMDVEQYKPFAAPERRVQPAPFPQPSPR